MCTYVYVYFHCVIKCLELWRMKCLLINYRICSVETIPSIISNSHSFLPLWTAPNLVTFISLYIWNCILELYLQLYPFCLVGSVYHFLWLVFLEFLSGFFFFLHRGEHLDTITKSLLSIIDLNLTNFLRHASWNPLASYSNLNIFQATKLPC